MTPKLQLIKGLAAILNSLDSTPAPVVIKPIANEERVPLYNVQNSTTDFGRREIIKSPYTEDYLRDMFSLKPLGEIKSNFRDYS